MPGLLGAIPGSLSEIAADEQLHHCTAGSVSINQTKPEEAEKKGKKEAKSSQFFILSAKSNVVEAAQEMQPFPLEKC